jgi:hypothetical protein
MNAVTVLHSVLILAIAFLLVFFEASSDVFRHLFGTQIDFLPSLMVYTSMTQGIFTIALLALGGGLCFDSLSANPLGVSVLPLFLIGLLIYRSRDLLWRENPSAQFFFGLAASALQPLATLFILLNIGHTPLLGWKSLWQWIVLAVGGGVFAPLCFILFRGLHRTLDYQPIIHSGFRPDREIKRGRG